MIMDCVFLRQYQINALKALQGNLYDVEIRGFCLRWQPGREKTLTSAAVIRLFLRSGNANRVAFLVDRIELENQAKKNFQNYLAPDYHTVIFKENVDDWRKAEVVVSTVQTLMFNNKYKRFFKPTDFPLSLPMKVIVPSMETAVLYSSIFSAISWTDGYAQRLYQEY